MLNSQIKNYYLWKDLLLVISTECFDEFLIALEIPNISMIADIRLEAKTFIKAVHDNDLYFFQQTESDIQALFTSMESNLKKILGDNLFSDFAIWGNHLATDKRISDSLMFSWGIIKRILKNDQILKPLIATIGKEKLLKIEVKFEDILEKRKKAGIQLDDIEISLKHNVWGQVLIDVYKDGLHDEDEDFISPTDVVAGWIHTKYERDFFEFFSQKLNSHEIKLFDEIMQSDKAWKQSALRSSRIYTKLINLEALLIQMSSGSTLTDTS